jgi:hypothetical protein
VGEFADVSADQAIERCRGFLSELRKDVLELHANQAVWKEVTDAMRAVAFGESDFWLNHCSRIYHV